MSDKPKRSERTRPLWGLRSLIVLYALTLIPYLFDFLTFIFLLIGLVFVLSVLLVGGYFMGFLGQLKELKVSILINLIISMIGAASTMFVGLLFTASSWLGLLWWVDFASRHIPFIHPRISDGLFPLIIIMIVSTVLCFVLAFKLQMQFVELINPLPNYEAEIEKQKNDNGSSQSIELEEPDIPLELLAETEAAEQAQR